MYYIGWVIVKCRAMKELQACNMLQSAWTGTMQTLFLNAHSCNNCKSLVIWNLFARTHIKSLSDI